MDLLPCGSDGVCFGQDIMFRRKIAESSLFLNYIFRKPRVLYWLSYQASRLESFSRCMIERHIIRKVRKLNPNHSLTEETGKR